MPGTVRLGGWTRLWIVFTVVVWPLVVVIDAYRLWTRHVTHAVNLALDEHVLTETYLRGAETFTAFLQNQYGWSTLLLAWLVPPVVVYLFGLALGWAVRWVRAGFRGSC